MNLVCANLAHKLGILVIPLPDEDDEEETFYTFFYRGDRYICVGEGALENALRNFIKTEKQLKNLPFGPIWGPN